MNEGRGATARPRTPPIARRAPHRPAEKTLPPGKGKGPPDDFFTSSPREVQQLRLFRETKLDRGIVF